MARLSLAVAAAAGMGLAQAYVLDETPAACTVKGYLYLPHNMQYHANKSYEVDWHWCQLRCRHTVYCEYFGYWPDHGCHLQGETFELDEGGQKVAKPVELTKAICFDGSNNCTGMEVISGPKTCDDPTKFPDTSGGDVTPVKVAPKVPPGCTVTGYLYEPHNMESVYKSYEANWEACQRRCKTHAYCEHFAFWPDHGCHIQGNNVNLMKAMCFDGSNNCSGLSVITGPADCSNTSTFPDISALGPPAAVLPPPATTPAPPTTVELTTPVPPTTVEVTTPEPPTTPEVTTPEPPTTVTLTTPEPPTMPATVELTTPAAPEAPTTAEPVATAPPPPPAAKPIDLPAAQPQDADIARDATGGSVAVDDATPEEAAAGGGLPVWAWIFGLVLLGAVMAAIAYATGMFDAACAKKKTKRKKNKTAAAAEDEGLLGQQVIETQQQPMPMYAAAPGAPQAIQSGARPMPMYQGGIQSMPSPYAQQPVQYMQQPLQFLQQP